MVIIRVLAIGESGREHVDILNDLARGPFSLVTYNHVIPLLELLHFEDITFGVFPKIGGDVRDAYGYWAENSVGDILDMLLQCLEVCPTPPNCVAALLMRVSDAWLYSQ